MAEGFDSLFGAFRDRFTEVCGLLFPGGEGRLRAVVGDDGEAGIEVEVVPAGKRPRSLSLMSGGERTWSPSRSGMALAMARPAPFYVLDEVEAALDDVNLRRFLGVVKRLAGAPSSSSSPTSSRRSRSPTRSSASRWAPRASRRSSPAA